ncbi:MAG: pilus assembly protein PilM [Candidatus Krumholzibacteria bacterium]|nr:pilus assembly protein PilM [Candidatus Krumholzibacteria bacterium]
MKLFSKKSKSSIGLDIGSSLIKVVEIDHSKGEPMLTNYGVIKLPPEAIVEGELMDQSLVVDGIRECVAKAGIEGKRVVTAVSGRAVIVKKVVMDKMNPDDAREAIFWEAEQHVPFDIDDVCLDFQVLKEDVGANQMEILLVAAKKEMVNAHAALIREAGLIPVIIDVDSFAVQNAIEATGDASDDHRVVGLVNIGSDVTNINIIQNRIPYFTRDLSVGSNVFVEAVQRELGVDFEEADALLSGNRSFDDEQRANEIIAEAAGEISMGIERSVSFLKTAGDADRIDQVILSGGGARIPGLRDILARKHDMEFKIGNPVAGIDRVENVFENAGDDVEKVGPLLTVAMGLALRREAE